MNKSYRLLLLGFGHFLVDLQGIYLINRQYREYDFRYILLFFIVYNIIAFGFQSVLGYIADSNLYYKNYVFIGLILPSIGLLLINFGLLAIIIATLGNALYHVGGGVISVNLYPGKSAPAGAFVAPGALGVFLGVYLSTLAQNYTYYIIGVTVIVLLLILTSLHRSVELHRTKKISESLFMITVLICTTVLIRGLVGFNLLLTWKDDTMSGVLLVSSVFLGKFLGGYLGDRFGFKQVGIYGLILSIPLLLLGSHIEILGLLGAFGFNLTMAITLFIIIDSYGKYQGFAFGLTTLSLLIAVLLSELVLNIQIGVVYYILLSVIIGVGAFTLHKAIKLYEGDEVHV